MPLPDSCPMFEDARETGHCRVTAGPCGSGTDACDPPAGLSVRGVFLGRSSDEEDRLVWFLQVRRVVVGGHGGEVYVVGDPLHDSRVVRREQ